MRLSFTVAAWLPVLVIAGAGYAAAQADAPAADSAPEPTLCAFVNTVAAARPNAFAEFMGKRDPSGKGDVHLYDGTLRLEPDLPCSLSVRREVEGEWLPAQYSCRLAPTGTFAEAERVYEQASAELKICFPQASFNEEKIGDAYDGNAYWQLASEQPEFTLALELNDWGALAHLLYDEPSMGPTVFVDVIVGDKEPSLP